MVSRLQSTTLLPRRRKLQCRNGYFLEVRPDGTVRGTKNNNSIYSEFKNWSLTLKLEFHFTKKGRKGERERACTRLANFSTACHFRKQRRNAGMIVYGTNVPCNFSRKLEINCMWRRKVGRAIARCELSGKASATPKHSKPVAHT